MTKRKSDRKIRNAGLRRQTTMCMRCAGEVVQNATTGRWRDYCSSACRQAAYRARRATR